MEKAKEGADNFLDRGIRLFHEIFSDKYHSPETGEKLETFREARGGVFGEAWESILTRKFPVLGKIMDTASFFGLQEADAEEHPWQNEIEQISALTMFIPDFLLKRFTDPIRENRWFQVFVKAYPLDEKLEKDLESGDPDAVINFLRMVHQDLIAGKRSISEVFTRLSA